MIKFELDKVDNDYARFRAEFDSPSVPPNAPNVFSRQTLYFSMQIGRWRESGRPVELLISVEGLTAK